MQTCPHCGHQNQPETGFCENCSQQLPRTPVDITHLVRPKALASARETSTSPLSDTTQLGHKTAIVLYLQDAPDPIILPPAERILLGRGDVQDDEEGVVVDLSSYSALKKGVSRLHAVIERQGSTLVLIDQVSVNGTYLNGQRLAPYDPHFLENGDEIRVGTLVMYCFFRFE